MKSFIAKKMEKPSNNSEMCDYLKRYLYAIESRHIASILTQNVLLKNR